jgi:uncharacterized protein
VANNGQNVPKVMEPLNDMEFEALNDFLLSDDLSEETLTLDGLDGYLTALVIGPVAVPPSEWLPGVWGPDESHEPVFEQPVHARVVAELILRHMNAIVSNFVEDTDDFEPLFATTDAGEEGQEYIDAEPWVSGFFRGVELRRSQWQPLLDDPRGQAWLRPLMLLGAEGLSEEEQALAATPAQRAELARQIPAGLAAIYRHWLPQRTVVPQSLTAETVRRDAPKVGRNDPCSCGSGKKFKKCCGAAQD